VAQLLFLTPAFPPFPGGGERYVRSLALALGRRGHSVTVCTSTAEREADFWRSLRKERVEERVDDRLQVVRLPLTPFPARRPGLLAWRKAMVLLSSLPGDQTPLLKRMARWVPPIEGLATTLDRLPHTFDLVHLFNLSWEYPLVAGWELAQRRGWPLVATPFAHLGNRPGDRVARNSLMDHQRRILRESGAVLTLTSIEAEALVNLCALDGRRVSTVGGGLDPAPETTPVAETLARYGLALPLVLFIGRLSYDKGALHAAEAVLALRQQGLGATLALVGQVTPEFERFYRRLGQAEQRVIRPLHVLTEEEKHALLSTTSMLLLPSRTDSFGIVLLEAWAHGKPVIGARAGGIPEVINDGGDGLLVSFGDAPALADAIRRLLTNETVRRTMGEAGRRKVAAHYTWDQVAERVEASYEQLLSQK
jgi:glycogen synthase